MDIDPGPELSSVAVTSDLILLRYYAAVDDGDLDGAMEMVATDAAFAIHLPAGARRGHDREGLRDYLSGRGGVVRRHVPLRSAAQGDVEFVYGAVREDDRRTTGHFLASARLDADGRIAAYQVSFDTEMCLLSDTTDHHQGAD